MTLPNLIIIGAPKCGTTSLYFYLAHHPEVFMSRQKELNFFNGQWHRGPEWYASWFANAETPVRGEASPRYTAYPHSADVAERMHSLVPDAKLIYLVRDPIERLLSQYVDRVAHGNEQRPFAETIRPSPRNSALNVSRYAMQLEQFLRHYPQEQILVVDHADLLARRRDTLRHVFEYLGIDPSVDSPMFDVTRNQSNRKRKMRTGPLLPTKLLPSAEGRINWYLRARVKRTVFKGFSDPIPRPELEPERREALSDLYAPEVERLRALTGRAFSTWSV